MQSTRHNLLTFVVFLSALVSCATGCSNEEEVAAREAAEAERDEATTGLAATKAELSKTKVALDKAKAELSSAAVELNKAKSQIEVLTQTARYFFDQAVTKMKASDDDSGDKAAIVAFQVVVDRYPEDPLAKVATDRIGELKDRVKARAEKLKKEQAKVVKLIKLCRSNTKAAKNARDSSLRFNAFNDLDMNSALAGSRRAEKLEAKAKKAKEKAGELLKDVPDPGGKLAKKLEKCDGT